MDFVERFGMHRSSKKVGSRWLIDKNDIVWWGRMRGSALTGSVQHLGLYFVNWCSEYVCDIYIELEGLYSSRLRHQT